MTVSAKRKIILSAVLFVLALSALVCWASFRPEALKPVYDIPVHVSHPNGTENTYQIATTAQTLYEAQTELGLIECVERNDDPERLFVTAVEGDIAYTSLGQYWLWNRNGEYSSHDIDTQPIADGDVFDFYIYTVEQ